MRASFDSCLVNRRAPDSSSVLICSTVVFDFPNMTVLSILWALVWGALGALVWGALGALGALVWVCAAI
jgi:hypothetical protein